MVMMVDGNDHDRHATITTRLLVAIRSLLLERLDKYPATCITLSVGVTFWLIPSTHFGTLMASVGTVAGAFVGDSIALERRKIDETRRRR